MAETYVVRQEGLTLDLILWRRFGRQGPEIVSTVYSLNIGLAALGPILPFGTAFLIPDAMPKPQPGIAAQPVDLFG